MSKSSDNQILKEEERTKQAEWEITPEMWQRWYAHKSNKERFIEALEDNEK